MPLKLYTYDISPAVRPVTMLCDIYKLPIELIEVDLAAGEHLKPEYLKLNPLHSVPVLVDGDLVIHDSHTILIYLASTYGNDDSLYPKDSKQRALINQKLFFHNSMLFWRLRFISKPICLEGHKGVTEKQLKDVEEGYALLEEFLTRNKYIATNNLTIADIIAFPTVTGLAYISPPSTERYPKLNAWVNDLKRRSFHKNVNKADDEKYGRILQKALE